MADVNIVDGDRRDRRTAIFRARSKVEASCVSSDDEITVEDVRMIFPVKSENILVPPEYTIIHVMPQDYTGRITKVESKILWACQAHG